MADILYGGRYSGTVYFIPTRAADVKSNYLYLKIYYSFFEYTV